MHQIIPGIAKKLRFVKMLKFLVFILLMQLFFQSLKAQTLIKLRSTLSQSGSSKSFSSSGKEYLIQQSIGQSSTIGMVQSDKIILRQGFIQPNHGQSDGIISEVLLVSVSPNPFMSDITLTFVDNITDDLYLTLYDSYGKSIFCKRYGAVQILNINFNNIATGLYILRVNSGNKYFSAKLIRD
jgi:Secretion system C-terminal sorting domain